MAVQWLRLLAPSAGGPGSILGQGTRSHMPQLKIPHATTKTQHDNFFFFLRKKRNAWIRGGTGAYNCRISHCKELNMLRLGIKRVKAALWTCCGTDPARPQHCCGNPGGAEGNGSLVADGQTLLYVLFLEYLHISVSLPPQASIKLQSSQPWGGE